LFIWSLKFAFSKATAVVAMVAIIYTSGLQPGVCEDGVYGVYKIEKKNIIS
jgi:hypothetical protein